MSDLTHMRRLHREELARISGNERGLKDYKSSLRGPDTADIVDWLALRYAVMRYLMDETDDKHWERRMRALRERNRRRREGAA